MTSATTEHESPISSGDPEDDEKAVRALFQKLLATWARGDVKAYAQLFTEDADYVAFDGINQKGRDAIARSHGPLFEKWLKGSKLTGEITSVRFLGPEVALLHASGGTVMRDKAVPDEARTSIQSLVAVKRDGVWVLTSFHNTRVRPIGGLSGVLFWQLTDGLWKLFGGKKQLESTIQTGARNASAT